MSEAIFATLEENPPGVEMELLCHHLGLPFVEAEALIEQGMVKEELERWPFWPDRIRSTGRNAPPFLQNLAELRRAAMPELERIAEVSSWPATLHLLVDGAHVVIERFPPEGDPEEISLEQSRYAAPRSLRGGATALAIVSAMPEPAPWFPSC